MAEERPIAAAVSCLHDELMRWPATVVARKALIARLNGVRLACMEDAAFLALLGALQLEDDDIEQALIWLERSLLLDSDNLSAQADFVIAMFRRGEPGPAMALALAWADRDDVPVPLRGRLSQVLARRAGLLARSVTAVAVGWSHQADVALLYGHENNLDRSPQLSELTLTVPDGSIVLPVVSAPRQGRAWLATAAYQFAWSSGQRLALRGGLSASARRSSRQGSTDWEQQQAALGGTFQAAGLRWSLDHQAIWVGGPLGDPFHQARTVLMAEWATGTCRLRASYDDEQRRQSRRRDLDAQYQGGVAGLQCALYDSRIGLGMSLRGGRDSPRTPDRPGGDQQVSALGLRGVVLLAASWRLELNLRQTLSRDSAGYSALLENNAVRWLRLSQATAELTIPLNRYTAFVETGGNGQTGSTLELLIQIQAARQRSNLPLFVYRADSAYTGLRWTW